MSIRSLTQRATATVFALVLLTACADVNGGDFNIDGGNWWPPWPWPNQAAVVVDKPFFDEVLVEGHSRIRLDGENGAIAITGQPDARSVRVTAELRVGSDTEEDALEGLDQLGVVVTDLADEVSIRTLQPHDNAGRQYVVNYTITIPNDLDVVVDQVNGGVTVADVESSVDVDVTNGDVDGTVTLPPNGEIRFSTGNGNLDLRIPTSTSATFEAFVDIGSITRENLDLKDVVRTNQSLTGILGDGAGVIRLETTIGNVHVTGFDR
jgi:hypothetical protein